MLIERIRGKHGAQPLVSVGMAHNFVCRLQHCHQPVLRLLLDVLLSAHLFEALQVAKVMIKRAASWRRCGWCEAALPAVCRGADATAVAIDPAKPSLMMLRHEA
jgi:hypothetical protein